MKAEWYEFKLVGRCVNSVHIIVDGLAVAERRYAAKVTERYTMRYTFDENNSPIGFDYKTPTGTWQHYYFVKNLQGDVVAMYHWYSATNCALVCTYEYDPWGKLL